MFCSYYRKLPKASGSVALLVLLACLVFPQAAFAVEAPVDEKTPVAQEKTFPGFNEVIPQATSVAARIAEAEAQVQQATNLDESYAQLDEKIETLKKLEEQFSHWEEIENWQFNRLLSARINYKDLKEQQQEFLESINVHLEVLEGLRNSWEQEERYWKEWQAFLRKTDVKLPSQTFTRTLSNIDSKLSRKKGGQ